MHGIYSKWGRSGGTVAFKGAWRYPAKPFEGFDGAEGMFKRQKTRFLKLFHKTSTFRNRYIGRVESILPP